MGFSPREVKDMSVFEYFSALDGWIAANVPEDEKSLSSKEKDDLAEWMGI